MSFGRWLPYLWALALTSLLGSARAHDPFEITSEGLVFGDGLRLEVTLALESALVLANAGRNPVSKVDVEHWQRHRPELEAASAALFELEQGGKPEPLLHSSVRAGEPGEVVFSLSYGLRAPGRWRLSATHLAILPEGYTSALKLTSAPRGTNAAREVLSFKVLHRGDATFDVVLKAPAPAREVEFSEATLPLMVRLQRFFVLGVEHMLTGYDHLLFLAGIVLGSGTLRQMLLVITGFTLAHSFGLAASVLDLVLLPSAWVELLIAGSIVYVGVENLTARLRPRRRLLLCFLFGLLHGLGFASALKDAGLDARGGLLSALGSFNLGLEVAQLGLVLVLVPCVVRLRARPVGPRCLLAGSLAVTLLGGYWLVVRAVGLA